MRVAVIGRTGILFKSIELLLKNNYEIPLVITSKEAPEYSKTSKDFENIANKIGAKFIFSSNLDNNIDEILVTNCDIAISLNFSTVISQKVIDLFPFGILNAHGGDLPKYRGNACQAWAILNGENKIGLCIHYMVGGELDSGDIVARKYFDININTKITDIYNLFDCYIPKMFLDSIKILEQDKSYILEAQSKNPKDVLRCYPRLPEDGRIDWNKSNTEILRLINASNKPYSGAFCFYGDKKVIIWDAELFFDNEIYLSEVGQIASINKDASMIVISGKGKLKINIIQHEMFIGPPGKIIKSIRRRLV